MFREFNYKKNVLLKDYSTIKIGGVADWIVFPKNILEIKKILKIIQKNNLKYIILGNGSNILFSDNGFKGVVISLKHFNIIKRIKNSVFVGAGVNLFTLNIKLKDLGLSGLEWSYGIPATIGGFVVMNGGCFENDIADFVDEVIVLDRGRLKRLKRKNIEFAYRFSNLKKYIVLYVKLRLKSKKNEFIEQKMNYFLEKKYSSQPCDVPSLGSVFKKVKTNETVYPAKLIDNLGLKGVKIGGAEISKKHAGFIVNSGGATCQDVLQLIGLVETKLAEVGVYPEKEIEIVEE